VLVCEEVADGGVVVLLDVCATAQETPCIQHSTINVDPTDNDAIAARTKLALRISGLRTGETFAMSIGILLDRIILYAVCVSRRKPDKFAEK